MSQFIEMFEFEDLSLLNPSDDFSVKCIDDTSSATKVPAGEYLGNGTYAIYDQSQDCEVAGYTDSHEGLCNNYPAVLFGDHSRVVKYINQPFFIGADGVKIIRPKNDDLLAEFLYYDLLYHNIPNTGYNRHFKYVKMLKLTEASVDRQKAFLGIAHQADKSKFVGFKSQFIEMFKNESLQVPLEKIVEVKDDCRKPINEGERSEMKEGDLYPYYGATGIVDYINDYITDEELLCIAEDCGNYKAGEESAYIIRGKAWVNNHAHLVKVKDSCDIKYLYYYLKITNLVPYVSGTTRLKLTQKKLKEILVTLPSAELQNRFVAIAQQADKSKYFS